MQLHDRVFVAGHRGLVGSALMRRLQAAGHRGLLTRTRAELDLRDAAAVDAFFERERPRHVLLAAATVGGIHANDSRPADFVRDNLLIQTNVIDAAHRHGVDRLLFLGSSCIYPRLAPQPIVEDSLLTGPLEPSNRAYAVAKIAGIEMCRSYNRQFGARYLAAMPTNLYGPGDNYHPTDSHVIPALIRRFHEAKRGNSAAVVVWGTGRPRREFLFSDDLAEACIVLMNLPDGPFEELLDAGSAPLINIGYGADVSIAELASEVADVVGYGGRIEFDIAKPDGTPRKLLETSRIRSLGWQPAIGLREGLRVAYRDFLARGEAR